MTNLFPNITPGTTTGSVAASVLNSLGRSDESAIKVVSGSSVLSTESGYYKEGTLVLAKDSGKFWLFSGGSFVDSGSVISTISGITGSSVMSDTGGSIVKHNTSGVVSGSYNQVEVNDFGHVTSGSVLDLSSGWYSANETWTYSSVDNPTGIVTVSGDVTGKYSPGMRLKFSNSGSTIYGIISGSASYVMPNTYITFLHEISDISGSSLAKNLMQDSAITANYYSTHKAPFGFPLDPTKWRIKVSYASDSAQSTPTANTWYNLGSITISIPIGVWCTKFFYPIQIGAATTGIKYAYATLSTTNNSESSNVNTASFGGAYYPTCTMSKEFIITSTSKTSYYLNAKTKDASAETIGVLGITNHPALIYAELAYL